MRHPFARWIARRALRWFYREYHIVGAERIPATGPVLLVGNHPNDLPDVLFGLLATRRPVRYVATAAAATSFAVRWVYDGMRVIPVTRVRDARKLKQQGADMGAANRVAFQRVTDALAAGDVVGVFPEGGVYDGPGIGPIRSGVARLALDGCEDGTIKDIKVVPIGLQYEAASEPGSDVLVVVGEAIDLREWLDSAPEPAHRAFTVELRRLLESVSRTAVVAADMPVRDRLLAAVGGVFAAGTRSWMPPILASAPFHASWPALLAEPGVRSAVELIGAAVERAGGRAVSARDCARLMQAAGTPNTANDVGAEPGKPFVPSPVPSPVSPMGLALRTPFALVAALFHWPALRFVWWLSQRISKERSDLAARAIVPGFYLIFAWYALLGALLALGMAAGGWHWLIIVPTTVLFVRILPRLGDFAVAWHHEWAGHRLARRVRRWPESERAAITASVHTLRSACASHIHGPEVSTLA